MNLSKVQEIYDSPLIDSEVNLGGWVRAFRANKFIELNDGSTLKNIQCVIPVSYTHLTLPTIA